MKEDNALSGKIFTVLGPAVLLSVLFFGFFLQQNVRFTHNIDNIS